MTQSPNVMLSFSGLGIDEQLLRVIKNLGFNCPTLIQHKCIPTAIKGDDIIGVAQTGTGKTLAFGIPMIQQILAKRGRQGIVLLPTRELALQVYEVLQTVGQRFNLKIVCVIGGAMMHKQVQGLRSRPDIVVATPGRLIDHIERRNYNLSNVKIVVLDEADRMLDIGFAPQIKQILATAPVVRQTLLFSATIPLEILKIANQYMKRPLRIEAAPSGTPAANIEQEAFIVNQDQKLQLLEKLLIENHGTFLVFCRTKHGVKKYTKIINEMGHSATEIHSNRSLAQRRAALDGFKSGKFRVLVATDIAARGIDVKNISVVVNYDLPDNLDDYVHRIGRTGRAGKSGKAISFITRAETYQLRRVEKIVRKRINLLALPVLPARRAISVGRDDNRPSHHNFKRRRFNRRRY